jgi:hypothetical protein
MDGIGVGAAAGVPGADADIRQQVGQGLAQGRRRAVIVAVVYQARTAAGSGSQWSIMVLAPDLR